jgi:asparagine synthase (glutamine-hydrolysing)
LWTLDASRSIHYRSDVEYERDFADIFRRAVRRRLHGEGPFVAEVSGGLDSSSIACVADAVLADRSSPEHSLRTVSYVYDESSRDDETAFIKAVEQKTGRQAWHIFESEVLPLATASNVPFTIIPSIRHVHGGFVHRLVGYMRSIGSTVLLRGVGGDHLMWSQVAYPPQLADYLRRLRLVQLHREAMAWAGELRRTYADMLLNGALWPLVPGPLRRFGRRRSTRLTLLRPEFRNRREVVDGWREICVHTRFASPSRRQQLKSVFDAILIVAVGYDQTWPIEMTYPFLDRDVIEFCVAAPIDQTLRRGQLRSLHRRALGGYLPEAVRMRTGKATFEESFARAVFRDHAQLKRWLSDDNLEVVKRGYVDRTAFRAAIDHTRSLTSADLGHLLTVIGAEIWLRNIQAYGQCRPIQASTSGGGRSALARADTGPR